MVDDEVNGDLRVHLLRVPAHLHHGVAQRRQIHHGRHPGEVLKDDAGRAEWNLTSLTVWSPSGNLANVVLGDEEAVVASQRALQENADGIR